MKKKQIDLLDACLELFNLNSVFDQEGNEYILIASNEFIDLKDIQDKTAFEAVQNHVHIFENIRSKDVSNIVNVAKKIGKVLIDFLGLRYPNKHFVVFITIDTSMTIRFHQKWKDEPWYYMLDFNYEGTVVIHFDN